MTTVCHTCIHCCRLEEGQRGLCGARKNVNGEIVCENYGQVTALAFDPIEKKPLKRFRPGSLILSAGSYGCNLRCPFCQNHAISLEAHPDFKGGRDNKRGDSMPKTIFMTPGELAKIAWEHKKDGNAGVAFTYNEPLIGWEFVRDTARLVKEYGMDSVAVTNGTVSLEVLEELLPFIDAMNIDLKGFSEEYYGKLGGSLEMVKAFIVRAAKDCHVELTTLIVPGENDSAEEMEAESSWIASVDRKIPLHVTRFFPRYHMTDRDATDIGQVYRLAETARRHLEYVFTGNC